MRTRLSIVIPHRNTPEKLLRLLDSIPESFLIDVVVVDDNSNPGREAHHLRPIYPNVRFFQNPGPDHNAGSARNHGLSQIHGEWVLFADADDYFVNKGLETVLASVELANPETEIVFFGVTSWNENEGRSGSRHESRLTQIDKFLKSREEIQLRYGWHPPWGKAIRVSLINQFEIRFDSVIAGNDVMFSMWAGHHARKIEVITSSIYCVTESSSSLTSNLSPARALSRLDVLSRENKALIRLGIKKKLNYGLGYLIRSFGCLCINAQASTYASYMSMCLMRIAIITRSALPTRDR